MKRISFAVLMAPVILLAGCGEDVSEGTAPKPDYPFEAPELEENPPMSSSDIDRIDGEISKQSKDK